MLANESMQKLNLQKLIYHGFYEISASKITCSTVTVSSECESMWIYVKLLEVAQLTQMLCAW